MKDIRANKLQVCGVSIQQIEDVKVQVHSIGHGERKQHTLSSISMAAHMSRSASLSSASLSAVSFARIAVTTILAAAAATGARSVDGAGCCGWSRPRRLEKSGM